MDGYRKREKGGKCGNESKQKESENEEHQVRAGTMERGENQEVRERQEEESGCVMDEDMTKISSTPAFS